MLPQNFFYMRRFMGPNYSRQDASNDEGKEFSIWMATDCDPDLLFQMT